MKNLIFWDLGELIVALRTARARRRQRRAGRSRLVAADPHDHAPPLPTSGMPAARDFVDQQLALEDVPPTAEELRARLACLDDDFRSDPNRTNK